MTTSASAQPDAVPWTHRTAPGADGNNIHYVVCGEEAPTVILLHGWPGLWYDWRHVIPALAEDSTVIAVDLRGFGDSPAPPGDPATVSGEANLGRDVIAVMDHIGVNTVTLGGFDVGAAVAEWIARHHPDRVAGLVLTNPTHPGIGSRRDEVALRGEFWYQQLHQLPWAAQLVAHDRETVTLYLAHFYRHWAAPSTTMPAEELDVVVDTYARDGAFEASIAWYRARGADRAAQALAAPGSLIIRHRTTVLWTDQDPVAPREWAEGIDAYFTNLTLHHVTETGHFLAWERPKPFIDAVRAQLKTPP